MIEVIKTPKNLRVLLVVSLSILVVGVFFLINFNRNKTSQQNTDLVQEATVSENSETNLLDGFPVYPDAVEETSYTTKGENTSAISTVWLTEASISEVTSFYEDEIERGEWEIISSVEEGTSTSFSVEKGNLFGIIGIGRGEEGTIISVTIGKRAE